MSAFKILVTRTVFNNYSWDLLNGKNLKIASGPMFTRKASCLNIVNKLSKALKCKVEFIDLEFDFEE